MDLIILLASALPCFVGLIKKLGKLEKEVCLLLERIVKNMNNNS